MICPCCSGKNYQDCCGLYHSGKEIPSSAELLMRSRYSAYALPNGAYLMKTTYPSKRYLYSSQELEAWGKMNHWLKLEIVALPAPHQVEFKAFYIDEQQKEQIHHELSTFKRENHQWFYVSGKIK